MQGPGTFSNLTVQQLIVTGSPSGGVFIYNASGQLIASVSNAAADPLTGHAIDPQVAVYGSAGTFVQMNAGAPATLAVGSGDTAEVVPAKVTSGVFGSPAPSRFIQTIISAARTSGENASAGATIFVESDSADHSTAPEVRTVVSSDGNTFTQLTIMPDSYEFGATTGGLFHQILLLDKANSRILAGYQVVAMQPGTVAPETWHAMTPLLNGWTAAGAPNAPPQYRFGIGNDVEIAGTLNGTAATAPTFFTLPAGYRPATRQAAIACGATGNVTAAHAPYIQLDTSGNLTVNQQAALPATGVFVFSGTIPLDLV